MKITLPQISDDLTPVTDFDKRIQLEETLNDLWVTEANISQVRVKALAMAGSKLERVTASGARLEKTDFSDLQVIGCEFTAATLTEASWRRLLIKNSRCNGLQLQTSILKDVTFINCQLNLSNFRFSTLANVRFTDCVLDEADFYAANLRDVVFAGCTLNKTEFSGAKLRRADLRSSDITGLRGLSGLAGAIIDSTQLTLLAPVLAQQLGIIVQDG